MKHQGAIMEYAEERTRDLLGQYDNYIANCNHIRMEDVYKAVVDMPAKRFWVGETRVTKVIYAMMRGHIPKDMRPLKREMFEEILKRVLEIRKKHPQWSVSLCCSHAASQPAPKFYLTAGSAKIIICKARKKWNEEKRKRLRIHVFSPYE